MRESTIGDLIKLAWEITDSSLGHRVALMSTLLGTSCEDEVLVGIMDGVGWGQSRTCAPPFSRRYV